MHAVFVVGQIDKARLDEAEATLKNALVPRIKQTPGFVNGTWARSQNGSEARSMILFESEKAAKSMLDLLGTALPKDGPVEIKSTSVLEVRAQA